MFKIYIALVVSLWALSNNAIAQKKLFTLDDAVLGLRNGKFTPDNLRGLAWAFNDVFTQIEKNDSGEYLAGASPLTPQKKHVIITQKELNQLLKAAGYTNELKAMLMPVWTTANQFYLTLQGTVYAVNLPVGNAPKTAKKLYTLPATAENVMIHPTALHAAYTLDKNVYVQSADGTAPKQITIDGSSDIVYGTSVHRDEFGIDKGIFWNNAGTAFALYRMDQSMVTDYPIINWGETPATSSQIKYPFSGAKSHHVTLHVYQLATNTLTQIQTGEPQEQYLTNVSWNNLDNQIQIAIVNRAQNEMNLNAYNAATGAFVNTLFVEKNDKYVEPQHPAVYLANGKNEFIWQSQRSGYNHLYLYNSSGQLVKQLTSGNWLVNDYLGYNNKRNEAFFTATKDGYLNKNAYSVNLATGAIKLLTKNSNGIHNVALSKEANYLIDVHAQPTLPRTINLVNCQKLTEVNLLTANNKLSDYATAQVVQLLLKASDSTELAAKLLLPHNFDATKKYPAIVYLYNGPHLQLNTNGYPASGNLWYDYMTQQGFVMLVVDGRGSANRGFAFESAIHRKVGALEMQDQLVGVDYLKPLPYIDASRLGVHGWSYGGFMTTSLMLNYPNVFKVGVAGGPVLDWRMYEVMYTERYMDTPQENPEGYKATELISKAKNLKGKLLMIHGTDDPVVVWQHSVKFVNQCVRDGVQIDYAIYPNHEHNVLGRDRVHLMQKITDYFVTHLKP
jgi:dipeptidyl-peptidase 4